MNSSVSSSKMKKMQEMTQIGLKLRVGKNNLYSNLTNKTTIRTNPLDQNHLLINLN